MLTEQEKAARRAAFQKMNLSEKAEYIFAYYKLPIVLILLAAYAAGYASYRVLTRREELLFAGFCNAAVREETETALTEGFVTWSGGDPRRSEVCAYTGLYLSDDPTLAEHEYAYASRLKLIAAVNAKQLDVVLMDADAYRILSADGFLMELTPSLFENVPGLWEEMEPCLTENRVVLEDNELDVALGKAEEYRETAEQQVNGIDLSGSRILREADLSGTVYLGLLPGSTRLGTAAEYAAYLLRA